MEVPHGNTCYKNSKRRQNSATSKKKQKHDNASRMARQSTNSSSVNCVPTDERNEERHYKKNWQSYLWMKAVTSKHALNGHKSISGTAYKRETVVTLARLQERHHPFSYGPNRCCQCLVTMWWVYVPRSKALQIPEFAMLVCRTNARSKSLNVHHIPSSVAKVYVGIFKAWRETTATSTLGMHNYL